jgi:hypothetical protein
MGLGTVQGFGIDYHRSHQEECYHFGCHAVCDSFFARSVRVQVPVDWGC